MEVDGEPGRLLDNDEDEATSCGSKVDEATESCVEELVAIFWLVNAGAIESKLEVDTEKLKELRTELGSLVRLNLDAGEPLVKDEAACEEMVDKAAAL